MRLAPAFLFSKRKGGKKRQGLAPLDPEQVDVYVRLSSLAVPPGGVFCRLVEAARKSRLVLPPIVKLAAGQIRLMSAVEIFLTGSILASERGQLCGPLIPADRNGGCVPSFLLAEARRGRGAFLLPKSANAAL